jgi:ribosomal protein S18 acetylase RimI-like enzyme
VKSHPLDNPVWHSLTSQHAPLAVMNGHAGRYPADVAPFVAVDSDDSQAADQLRRLVDIGESVYLVGLAPPLTSGWRVQQQTTVAQMVCRARIDRGTGPQMMPLLQVHRADMLALTALVFPGFFRARTPEMGRYLGIYAGATLAAMAGERMSMDGYQEISAVCTHPDFLGRGFAAQLVAAISNASIDRGLTSFLHVSHENVRAKSLYERMGFVDRAAVPLWSLQRVAG